MDDRADRIARNEALFREVNERVRDLRGGESDGFIAFICECGDDACIEEVHMTVEEYESVRSDPIEFVIAHGHEVPEVEAIVAENERFVVARKAPGERSIAKQTDPRAD